MSRHPGLSLWMQTVSSHMPHLSKPQATVLALWSFGIALMRTCGRCTVARFLGAVLQQPETTVAQRLREWCYDAPDKCGRRRRELEVSTCFVPLLAWVVRLWQARWMALALDATHLGDRFVVLTVSVVYRGCAIPVAWYVSTAHAQGSWRPHWLRLLRQLRPAIPADWTVVVLTDRGLYARWLFRRIVRLGWHPLMRINRGVKFRPAGQKQWLWLSELTPQVGERWCGRGEAFHSRRRLACTLLAWWGEGHAEPWFLLTDLAPGVCQADWYRWRAWCEQGFKCLKRSGWQWQATRMTDPARASRSWLALAVAMLWVVSVGSEAEDSALAALPDWLPQSAPGSPMPSSRIRRIRVFRGGVIHLLASCLLGHPLPMPTRLIPDVWPIPLLSSDGEAYCVTPTPPSQKTYP